MSASPSGTAIAFHRAERMNSNSDVPGRSAAVLRGAASEFGVNALGVDPRTEPAGAELLPLDRGSLSSRILADRQVQLLVHRGRFWITFEGDSTDYVAEPGERLHFRGRGRLVIESLEDGGWIEVR